MMTTISLLFLLIAAVFGEEKIEKVDGPVIGIDLGTTYSMCILFDDVSLCEPFCELLLNL
jgi:hypothetical protein